MIDFIQSIGQCACPINEIIIQTICSLMQNLQCAWGLKKENKKVEIRLDFTALRLRSLCIEASKLKKCFK